MLLSKEDYNRKSNAYGALQINTYNLGNFYVGVHAKRQCWQINIETKE